MRGYLYALIFAILVAFIFGTGWYALFGYDTYRSVLENLSTIYKNINFWRGVGIWSILYALFFTLPIAFLKNRATEE